MVGRVRIANLANFLTGLRLVLVPIFMFALFYETGHDFAGRIVAFVIFAIACITDRLDGVLARNYGMATEFGAFVDPVADKALIGLSMLGDLPWWVTVLILTREVGVTLLRVAVIRRGVIAASWGGKLKTVVQALAIGLFVLPWSEFSEPFLVVASVVMGIAIVLTVVTGIDYVLSTVKAVRRPPT